MFQSFESRVDKAATPARLAALRARLAEAGVAGFLVPRADAHQGEYVAPRDERLAWLTGFSGSAGIAVVLAKRAALFVDGRYTLQAAEQTDAGLWEIVPSIKTKPEDWLAEVLGEGDRLGYDSWLHGKAEIDRLAEAAGKRGAQLVALDANPIDAVWADQPDPPKGAARVHDIGVAGEEAAEKRARIGRAVAEAGAKAAVLTLPDSISWLLNVRGSDVARSPVVHSFAILGADGRVDLAVDPEKLDDRVRAHLGNEVALHAPDALAGLVDGLAGPVLLDKQSCPLWFAERLEARGVEIVWKRDPCILPKATKNPAELAGMRAAHIRDGAAVARFFARLDAALGAGERLTEIEVVRRLEACRAEGGELSDIAFDTIAGSGPNGAIVHYRVTRATDRAIEPGDLLLVDSGGQYPDGTTDVTRTVATGPVSDEQRRHFTLVLKGMIGISRLRWPKGMAGRDLDPIARAALWRAGFDYDHGTGHGVGACLNVHEGPQSLSKRGEAPFEPGMVLSNEPGYYVQGSHGIRIENLVIVTEPSVPEGGQREMLGFETLTYAPIDRRLVEPALLEPAERAWLDAYHGEVKARIGPRVEGAERAWLDAACAPL